MFRLVYSVLLVSAIYLLPEVSACTSAIAWGSATADRLSVLWKNRDTGCLDNFVERVPPAGNGLGYVALFNAPDTLLREAWAGVNEAGFGIMNTASYNLAPDTARIRDREGLIMSRALRQCRTLADFESLLDTLPRPLGVQANFGATDRCGGVAYYETCDTGYVRYAGRDTDRGLMIRTNYSYSGDTVSQGFGYIRHEAAAHIIRPLADRGAVTPVALVTAVSRSFFHPLFVRDMSCDSTAQWLIDQDFIPRHSTSASVAVVSGDGHTAPYMVVALGYPPCSRAYIATPDSVPDELRPLGPGHTSAACNDAKDRKAGVFSIRRGSGEHYINREALLRCLSDAAEADSHLQHKHIHNQSIEKTTTDK